MLAFIESKIVEKYVKGQLDQWSRNNASNQISRHYGFSKASVPGSSDLLDDNLPKTQTYVVSDKKVF